MRIFVTGGAGFVGRHIVRRLRAAGAEVSVLVRAGSDRSVLPADVRRVTGELGARGAVPAQLRDSLGNADAVIHCAARLFASDWREYLRDNSLGAEHLATMIAAHGRNVQRVIMLSSLAAAGPCGDVPGIAEASPPAPVSAYGWSKLMAEWAMEKHVRDDRLTILRPPIVYGPEDKALAPLFGLAARGLVLQAGRGETPYSFLYVEDLVDAALLCLYAPRAAGTYHLEDGRPSSLREFGEIIARAVGRHPRRVVLPHALIRLAAQGSAFAARRLPGRFFPLTPDKALEGRQKGWLADGAKFRREFSFTATTALEQGVAATLRWRENTKKN
jgi:nucleoside-diphosphate-sugar epimerase